MQNNDNQKTYFIYVRSTGEKVPVTKEQHDSFYTLKTRHSPKLLYIEK